MLTREFSRQAATLGRARDFNGVQLIAGRAILALGTFITLAFNDASVLLHNPAPGAAEMSHCGGIASFGLFCQSPDQFEVQRFVGLAICLVAMGGVLPALSGVAYWYVATSVFLNLGPVDGGDQVSASLAFFLAIIGLGDRRLCGWRERRTRSGGAFMAFVNRLWWIIPLQVAFVYANSGLAKFSAPVWVDGTALWYWVQHPGFNASPEFQRVALDLLAHPFVSAAVTWGTIAFELGLAAVILLGGRHKRLRLGALCAGVAFHGAIAIMIGLVSFFFAMSGALVLSLWRPRDSVSAAFFSKSKAARGARLEGRVEA